jgi:starch-binding outer membrane protein, SusD/RagB family
MLKKQRFLLSPLLCTLLFISCTSFLDESSPNDINAENAISNAASAEAALIGIYSSLQNGAYYGGQFPLMSEPLCDNSSTGGYQFLSLDQLGSKSVTADNLLVEGLWTAIYRSIANCNYLLEALPKVNELDATRKTEIEGQARAIRALAHFDLLRHFGEHWAAGSTMGIPVITRVQKINDIPARASVSNTYQAIIDDLEFAVANINPQDNAIQFMTKLGAEALLARVFLFKGDKINSEKYANLVLENSEFALLSTAEYPNLYSGRRSSESIFELSFDAQNRSDYNGLTYAREDAIRPEVFYLAAKSLNDLFSTRPGDVRATMLDFSESTNNSSIIPDGRTQKYRGENSKDNPAYVIRLAELYLIRAELRGYPDGLADLNALRTIRGAEELQLSPAPDADTWQQIILEEIRAEFNFEGQYYSHLARSGKYAAYSGVEGFRAILPIPNREIAASGGKITQNSGY